MESLDNMPVGTCFKALGIGFSPVQKEYYFRITPNRGPIPNFMVASYLLDTAFRGGVDPFLVQFPSLVRVSSKLFHVNTASLVSFYTLLHQLFKFSSAFCGMDPQRMIEQSASVNASTISINEVSKLFRSQLESMVTVRTKLTKLQQTIIEDEVGPCVRFTGDLSVCHDHAVLGAFRELARVVYSRVVKPKQTRLKTLAVGVSMREVASYWDNENIYFHYDGREGKDTTRFAIEVLQKVASNKRRGIKDRSVSNSIKAQKVNDLIQLATSTGAIPDRFDQEFDGHYDQLLVEDVGYNWSESDWIDVFRKTGATVCYGYLCLPWELVFPVTVNSGYYDFYDRDDGGTVMGCIGFQHSNGYMHNKENWATLFNKQILRAEDFTIYSEIIGRYGPMTVIKLNRVAGVTNEVCTRQLKLPDCYQAVQVLDLEACTNRMGQINRNLVYINVRASEFYNLRNYVNSIDEKSLNIRNITTYIRRRTEGVSLIGAELVRAWGIKNNQVDTVARVALLLTIQDMHNFSNMINNLDVGGKTERWKSALRQWCRSTFDIPAKIIDWLCAGHLDGKLAIDGATYIRQFDKLGTVVESILNFSTEREYDDIPIVGDPDVPVCSICCDLKHHIGTQKLCCIPGSNPTHNFSLTKSEIASFRSSLLDVVNDPIALKDVKLNAEKHLPTVEFTTGPVEVIYIRGGPGSGKSRLIRSMSTSDDLILAPFSKLKSEYEGKNFATQHKAMTLSGYRRIFVDEFTAMPYEVLACVVHNCAAEVVYLVGDLAQTGIIEGVEGINTPIRLDFTSRSVHELKNNYRNPIDSVAVVNQFFNYDMRPMVAKYGFRFRHLDMWNPKMKLTPLCYSKNSAEAIGIPSSNVDKVTVRANQGQTYDCVALFLTSFDEYLLGKDSFNIVGLSRHRESCVLFHDDSAVALGHVARYKTLFNKLIDEQVLPPTTNTCLLSALCELLNKFSKTNFEVEDLWRNLVTLIGVDEACQCRNKPLNDKYLMILTFDLGVTIRFVAKNRDETFGDGPMIGTIHHDNNHFTAKPASNVVSAFDLAKYKATMKKSIDGSNKVEAVSCGCGVRFCCCKDIKPSHNIHTPIDLNNGLHGVVMTEYGSDTVQIFGKSVDSVMFDKEMVDYLIKLTGNVADTIVVALRITSGSCKIRPDDLPFSSKVLLGSMFATLKPSFSCHLGRANCNLKNGQFINLPVNFDHDISVNGAPLNGLLVFVGSRVDALTNSGQIVIGRFVVHDPNQTGTSTSFDYSKIPALSSSKGKGVVTDGNKSSDGASTSHVSSDGQASTSTNVLVTSSPISNVLPGIPTSNDGGKQANDGGSDSSTSQIIVGGVDLSSPSNPVVASLLANPPSLASAFMEVCGATDRSLYFATPRKSNVLNVGFFHDTTGDIRFESIYVSPEKITKDCMTLISDCGLKGKPLVAAFKSNAFNNVVKFNLSNLPFKGTVYVSAFGKGPCVLTMFDKTTEQTSTVQGGDIFKFSVDSVTTIEAGFSTLSAGLCLVGEEFDEESSDSTSVIPITNALATTLRKNPSTVLMKSFGQTSAFNVATPDRFRSMLVGVFCKEQGSYMIGDQQFSAGNVTDLMIKSANDAGLVSDNALIVVVRPDAPNDKFSIDLACLPLRGRIFIFITSFGKANLSCVTAKDYQLITVNDGDLLCTNWLDNFVINVAVKDPSAAIIFMGDLNDAVGSVKGGVSGPDVDAIPSFSAIFMDHIDTFAQHEPTFEISAETKEVICDEIVPLEQTPSDAYFLLREHFDRFNGMPAQFTNEVASKHVLNEFSRGKLNSSFLDQLNMRGHPVDNKVNFYSITTSGPGLYYHQKSKWQELQCLQARYLGQSLACQFDVIGEKIAYEIADLFVDEHMNVDKAILNLDEVNSTVLDSMRAMRTKNYEAQVHLENQGIDCNVVRFHMKDVFKPFKDKVDMYKAGQGISAWSKEAQSMFQTGCRLINLAFQRSLNSNVIYDNLIPEIDILERANLLLNSLPKVCSNGVIDATACDSGQNAFTQAIERRILERLGVAPLFIQWYYRFRKEYILSARVASANVSWIKTSGEPATLLCNTILMMALMNALLRGEGPCVLLGKGDDGLKRQAKLVFNKDLVGRFSVYTKLQFKVDIDQPVNFCGYSLVGSRLYPCILRKAEKVAGHKFRDYLHFREYQQALRDWVLLVNKLGVTNTVVSTCMFCGLSTEIVWSMFSAIQSLSHINGEQFYGFFRKHTITVDDDFPTSTPSDKGPFNFGAIGAL